MLDLLDSMATEFAGFIFCAGMPRLQSGVLLRATLMRSVVVLGGTGNPRIQFVEMLMEPLSVMRAQAGEFDSHANSWITGAHNGGCRNLLRLDPEIDFEVGPDRNWQDGLDITAVAADVTGVDADGCVDALVPQLHGKGHLVPSPPSAVLKGRRGGFPSGGQLCFPGTFLVTGKLHAYLNFRRRTRIDHPSHFAPRLVGAILHADCVANFEFVLNAGEQSAVFGDMAGASLLKEGTAVRGHAPNSHGQIWGCPGLRWVCSHRGKRRQIVLRIRRISIRRCRLPKYLESSGNCHVNAARFVPDKCFGPGHEK